MDGRVSFSDNIFVERLWRSFKCEEVYLKAYQNVAEARHSIAAYFEFYNHERLHQALGYRGPLPGPSRKRCGLPSFGAGEKPLLIVS
jgi:putative transposase